MRDKIEYQSGPTVSQRAPLYVDIYKDPRARNAGYLNLYASRIGAPVVTVNSVDGAFFIGRSVFNSTGGGGGTNDVSSNSKDPVSIISVPKEISYDAVSNLSASWDANDTLNITWDFDTTIGNNSFAKYFSVMLVAGTNPAVEYRHAVVNTSAASQTLAFDINKNATLFGLPALDTMASISVAAGDYYGNVGPYTTITAPTYTSGFTAPTITVTALQNGYSVSVSNVSSQPAKLNYISVEEYVSNATSEPTGVTYTQVSLAAKTVNPINVFTSTTAKRWVKVRFTSTGGAFGPYSAATAVTPTPVVVVDNIPPSEVTAVSAAWSGDDIVINYTLPSTDAGIRFVAQLTSPTSSAAYFYIYTDGTANLNQTAKITKADLFNQFGAYYSSFTGVFKSIDAADNRSNGVSFNVAARANPLAGITPTFTAVPTTNSYTLTWSDPIASDYAEVYQSYSSWSGVTNPIDAYTASCSSGGASGSSTLVVTNIKDNDGNSQSSIRTGYLVSGTGIPSGSPVYVTNFSSGTVTLSQPLNAQASGTYTFNALVYQGHSPANIQETLHIPVYIVIRYYDAWDNYSNLSAEQTVTSINPVTADTTGPSNVTAGTTSYSQGIDSTGSVGFNGYITLNWVAVTGGDIRGYKIRFTTDNGTTYSYIDVGDPAATTARLTGLAVGASYKVSIATYDNFNNLSTQFSNFNSGNAITISGTPALSNYITTGTTNFQFGTGIKDSTGSQNPSAEGLYFNNNNYWYLTSSNSAKLKVGGATDNYLLWDGTSFTIDGNIKAQGGSFAGNVALTTTGASIYNGDVTTNPGSLTGDGFIFNKNGLTIQKGSNQIILDATNGNITSNAGTIAGWTISGSKIEKLNPTSGKYAGLSPTGLYAFWAGSDVAGGDTNQFAVDRTGKVYATSMQISGGSLDIGAASPNGFHVNTSGNLTAGNATLSGAITATSGSITGNFQVVSGAFYAGSLTGSRVAISSAGLSAYDANQTQTTSIVANATAGSPTFTTVAATIGGFTIDSSNIKNSSGTLTLTSTTSAGDRFTIQDASGAYKLALSIPSSGTPTDNIISAGLGSLGSTAKPFRVTADGSLYASNATITGTIRTASATSYPRLELRSASNKDYIYFYDALGQPGAINVTGLGDGGMYFTAPSAGASQIAIYSSNHASFPGRTSLLDGSGGTLFYIQDNYMSFSYAGTPIFTANNSGLAISPNNTDTTASSYVRNISATTTTGYPTGGNLGDIVLVREA